MMYCTENPQTKQQWEKVHSFFASEDYGFMMENTGMAAVQIRQVKVWVSLQSMIGEMEQRLKRTTHP